MMPTRKSAKPSKIAAFDPSHVRAVGREIETALQDVAQKYGVQIKYGGGSYTASNVTYRIHVAVIDGGTPQTREREALEQHGPLVGAEGLADKTFEYAGEQYTVTGLRPRARKNPLLCRRSDGKTYSFPVDVVRRLVD